jgi:hypothetical protein
MGAYAMVIKTIFFIYLSFLFSQSQTIPIIVDASIKLQSFQAKGQDSTTIISEPLKGAFFSTSDNILYVYETSTFGKYGSPLDNYILQLEINPNNYSYQRLELFNGKSIGNNFVGPKIKYADGKYIYAEKWGEQYDIFIFDTIEINLTRTKEIDELNPRISPDAKHVAFIRDESLFLLNIGKNQRIFISEGIENYSFSPNSKLLAFSTLKRDLNIYNIISKSFSQLPDSLSDRFMNPVFLDNENVFCYEPNFPGNFSLVLFNLSNHRYAVLLTSLMPMGVYAYNHEKQELYILVNSTDFRKTTSAEEMLYFSCAGKLHALSADWDKIINNLKEQAN